MHKSRMGVGSANRTVMGGDTVRSIGEQHPDSRVSGS